VADRVAGSFAWQTAWQQALTKRRCITGRGVRYRRSIVIIIIVMMIIVIVLHLLVFVLASSSSSSSAAATTTAATATVWTSEHSH